MWSKTGKLTTTNKTKTDKNSSGDEIANVNLLLNDDIALVLQNTKKRTYFAFNKLR